MRTEHDEAQDIVRTYFSEEPPVRSEESGAGGARTVTHFDASGRVVLVEMFGASKAMMSAPRSTPAERSTDEQVLFTLDWTFVDFEDSENPVSGKTVVRLCDIEVKTIDSKDVTVTSKSFPLNDRLVFTLADSGCDTPNGSGMAFKVMFAEPGTFSWEWFAPKGDRLLKIQEFGELLPTYRPLGDRFEIADITLTSDLSLRFQMMADGPHTDRFYRLNLNAGTFMRWPTVVDGKVTMP